MVNSLLRIRFHIELPKRLRGSATLVVKTDIREKIFIANMYLHQVLLYIPMYHAAVIYLTIVLFTEKLNFLKL